MPKKTKIAFTGDVQDDVLALTLGLDDASHKPGWGMSLTEYGDYLDDLIEGLRIRSRQVRAEART